MSVDLILDSKLREAFDRDGFAYTPFLLDEDVEELLEVYRQTNPAMTPGFYTTLWNQNVEHRERVHTAICRVFDRRLGTILSAAKYVLTQFAVKQGGHTGTECPLHQDWSLTDESSYSAVSIWCPLVDVDAHNGQLAVVPGSQRIASKVRPNMPSDLYYSPVSPLYPVFQERYLRELPMQRGGAILYNGALTHGSRPNRSSTDRPAVVAGLVEPEAPVLHYWMRSRSEVEVFEVSEDFYRSGVELGRPPIEGRLREVLSVPDAASPISEADFLRETEHLGVRRC